MAYLLSKPDDWQVRMEDLLGHGPCGLSAMRRIVKELEGRGFLRRVRGRTQDGRFQWFTEVWESPLPDAGAEYEAGVVAKVGAKVVPKVGRKVEAGSRGPLRAAGLP
jgi:hypothetical protein